MDTSAHNAADRAAERAAARAPDRAPERAPERAHNYVHACVLLLLAERAGHGYELAARLAAFGISDAKATGTYRALRGLERGGLVVSHWKPAQGGPARRVYHLTQPGREALRGCGAEVLRDARQIAVFLRRLDALSSAWAEAPEHGEGNGAVPEA